MLGWIPCYQDRIARVTIEGANNEERSVTNRKNALYRCQTVWVDRIESLDGNLHPIAISLLNPSLELRTGHCYVLDYDSNIEGTFGGIYYYTDHDRAIQELPVENGTRKQYGYRGEHRKTHTFRNGQLVRTVIFDRYEGHKVEERTPSRTMHFHPNGQLATLETRDRDFTFRKTWDRYGDQTGEWAWLRGKLLEEDDYIPEPEPEEPDEEV